MADESKLALLIQEGRIAVPKLDQRRLLVLHYGHQFGPAALAAITASHRAKVEKTLIRLRKRQYEQHNIVQDYPLAGRAHEARAIEGSVTGTGPFFGDPTVDEHIRSCADCEAYLNGFRALDFKLAQALIQGPDLSEAQQAEILSRKPENELATPSRRRLPFREIAWVGIVFALFLLSIRATNRWLDLRRPTSTPLPTATPLPPTSIEIQFFERPVALYEEAQRRSATESVLLPQSLREPEFILAARPNLVVIDLAETFALFAERTLIRIWNLETDRISELEGHREPIRAIVLGPDLETFISADLAGEVLLWSLADRAVKFRLEHPSAVNDLAIDGVTGRLFVAHEEGLWIWDLETDRAVRISVLTQAPIAHVAVSGDGQYLATAQADHHITIWSLETSLPELRFQAHEDEINDLAFTPESHWHLISISEDSTAKVFSLTKISAGELRANLLHSLRHPAAVRSLSVSGRNFAATAAGLRLYAWDTELGMAAETSREIRKDFDVVGVAHTGENLWAYSGHGALLQYALSPLSARSGFQSEMFQRAESNLIPFVSPLPAENRWILVEQDAANLDLAAVEMSEQLGIDVKVPALNSAQFNFVRARFEPVLGIAAFDFRVAQAGQEERLLVTLTQQVGTWPAAPVGKDAEIWSAPLGIIPAEFALGDWQVRPEDDPTFPVDGFWRRWHGQQGLRLRWREGNLNYQIYAADALVSTDSHNENKEAMARLANSLLSSNDLRLTVMHAVIPGETFISIGIRYGSTVEQIETANDLASCELILAGQDLIIPLSASRELVAEVDLNCDAVAERVMVIPDPETLGSFTNFGVVVESRLAGPESDFVPVWELTIAHIAVDFFGFPQIFFVPGVCSPMLGVSPFGGKDGEGGFDIYAWNGQGMDRLLDTDGFLQNELPILEESMDRFTIQRLVYDPDTATCTSEFITFARQNGAFREVDSETIEGHECFGSP